MKNIALLLSAFLIISCQKKQEEQNNDTLLLPTDTVAKPAMQETCYLKVVEKDSIIFRLEREGDSITGIFDWKPYEKDKKISTFKGVMSGNTGNAIANYQAEGMEYNEELIFTLGEDNVSVNYGVTEQGADGIWRYKDKNINSVQVLPKVDCNILPARK